VQHSEIPPHSVPANVCDASLQTFAALAWKG
jgi:hypothetical protein